MTSKELVLQTLEFKNPSRIPRQLWTLPWAHNNHSGALAEIQSSYPDDIIHIESGVSSSAASGNLYEPGESTDDWGCCFQNVHRGIIGEVKRPIIINDDWSDCSRVHIPEEWLDFDASEVNARIKKHGNGRFILPGHWPRPFEQLQFMRGTEKLYMDIMDKPPKMLSFIEKMHDFYCRLVAKWAAADIDGLMLMDDWGSQNSLLISPELWKSIFMPMYRDYADIAKKHGKKIFMHSDGNILDIIPSLINIGIDAVNSQIFCMGLDKLKQFKGKITFWGEIDRQYLLPRGTVGDITKAVNEVYAALYHSGGCIAQCEFGAGAKPENVRQVFTAWNRV